jgi:O-methyltransferase
MSDVQSMYLDLLRRNLTRYGVDELIPVHTAGRPLAHLAVNALKRRNLVLARAKPFDEKRRDLGLDWPVEAETMIGMRRLTSLQQCVETVLAEDIPGDLVECGVWRGGACILMRAVLDAYGDEERCVWLADSFAGLPAPDAVSYPADGDVDRLDKCSDVLAVAEADVRANFQRYGLLDERVRFLVGWFKDTLPGAPMKHIALLRLDGDFYESTIQALDALYPRLSPGGYCIIDDYHAIEACSRAVTDYRAEHGVTDDIIEIDGSGVLWRKG